MGDVINSIDRSFQRLLRWIYPGLLIAVLFYLSQPSLYKRIVNCNQVGIWGYLVGCITLGCLAYLLQVYFIQQVLLLTVFRTWKVDTDTNKRPERKLAKYLEIDKKADEIEQRGYAKGTYNGTYYMDYIWAITHVLFISCWLIIIFLFNNEESSLFHLIKGGVIWLAVVLFISAMYQFAIVTRVTDP